MQEGTRGFSHFKTPGNLTNKSYQRNTLSAKSPQLFLWETGGISLVLEIGSYYRWVNLMRYRVASMI